MVEATGAGPGQAAACVTGGEGAGAAVDFLVDFFAVFGGDNAVVADGHFGHIRAGDGGSGGHASGGVVGGEAATLGPEVGHAVFGAGHQHLAFRHLSADGVVLIGGQGDGGQNTDDGHDDHQFDEGKTFLDCFHDVLLERGLIKGMSGWMLIASDDFFIAEVVPVASAGNQVD